MKKLYCVVGRTSSGKDTVARYLAETYNLKQVVSYATRPMRPKETDGVEHYFITPFESRTIQENNDIVAYTKIGNVEYFATLDELMKSDIYVIDPEGIRYLKEFIFSRALDIELIVIGIYAHKEDIFYRAGIRGDDEETLTKRYLSESEMFDEFFDKDNNCIDYLFVNDKGLDALERYADYIYYDSHIKEE